MPVVGEKRHYTHNPAFLRQNVLQKGWTGRSPKSFNYAISEGWQAVPPLVKPFSAACSSRNSATTPAAQTDDIPKSIAESVSGTLQFAEGDFLGLAEAMPSIIGSEARRLLLLAASDPRSAKRTRRERKSVAIGRDRPICCYA
jgi:hypothetical protein